MIIHDPQKVITVKIIHKLNLLAVMLTFSMTLLGTALFTSAAGAAETNPNMDAPVTPGKASDGAGDASGTEMSEAELAKQILNPLAALISVPVIFLGDYSIGPDDGERLTLGIFPVIPFELNQDWNLITRTTIPVIKQHAIPPAGEDTSGLGDIAPGFFFSPVKPTTVAGSGVLGRSSCSRLRPTICSVAGSGASDRPPSC